VITIHSIRKMILPFAIAAIGLLVTGRPAHAFLLTGNAIDVSPGDSTGGSFHVVINVLSATSFSVVSINGNADNTDIADHQPGQVAFTLYKNITTTVAGGVVDPIASTVGTAGTDVAQLNYGAITFAGPAAHTAWIGTGTELSVNTPGVVYAFGAGSTVTTTVPFETIQVDLQNGAQYEVFLNTPEPATCALLLPGLLPLGLLLRRRFSRT
jgi:hypothetical protein